MMRACSVIVVTSFGFRISDCIHTLISLPIQWKWLEHFEHSPSVNLVTIEEKKIRKEKKVRKEYAPPPHLSLC
jgi:hypothetical protein